MAWFVHLHSLGNLRRGEARVRSMKLLIAEDDALFCGLLEQILAPDHELVVTHDGNQAWAALQHHRAPQLAILDWVMPGLSGPETCRRVKAYSPLSSTYLIIFTAKNNTADIVSGLRAGADDYITKPPIPEELRARVSLGERVLALQDALEAQSILASEARERRIRDVAAPPLCRRPTSRENSYGVETYLSQHIETADDCSRTCVEAGVPRYRLSTHSLENSHS